MVSKFTSRLIVWSTLPLLLIVAAGLWFAFDPGFRREQQTARALANMPKDEFEQRVQKFILDHPEVVAASLDRMEARRRAADELEADIDAHADELFRDSASPVGGNPSGEVTLVEFFDYNCPYCRQMAPVMIEAEKQDPQLRVVFKEFPILGPNSVFAAKAGLAANTQGKYVAFHNAMYQAPGAADQNKVMEVARSVGLDVDRLKADIDDPAIAALIEKNLKLAEVFRINGTPGFVAGRQVVRGATDLKGLQGFIEQARAVMSNKKTSGQ